MMDAHLHLKWNGQPDKGFVVALAHGAGAPMDSSFMEMFAIGLCSNGFSVVRFEFPYMQRRRVDNIRRPPDSIEKMQNRWREVISRLVNMGISRNRLIIGGKSMGGRVASMIADSEKILGLVCLGYPFHPPGKPEIKRTEHLELLKAPSLFVQGTRDTLGSADDVREYTLSPSICFRWIKDGDHNLKPRKSTNVTHQHALEEGVNSVADFIYKISKI